MGGVGVLIAVSTARAARGDPLPGNHGESHVVVGSTVVGAVRLSRSILGNAVYVGGKSPGPAIAVIGVLAARLCAVSRHDQGEVRRQGSTEHVVGRTVLSAAFIDGAREVGVAVCAASCVTKGVGTVSAPAKYPGGHPIAEHVLRPAKRVIRRAGVVAAAVQSAADTSTRHRVGVAADAGRGPCH